LSGCITARRPCARCRRSRQVETYSTTLRSWCSSRVIRDEPIPRPEFVSRQHVERPRSSTVAARGLRRGRRVRQLGVPCQTSRPGPPASKLPSAGRPSSGQPPWVTKFLHNRPSSFRDPIAWSRARFAEPPQAFVVVTGRSARRLTRRTGIEQECRDSSRQREEQPITSRKLAVLVLFSRGSPSGERHASRNCRFERNRLPVS